MGSSRDPARTVAHMGAAPGGPGRDFGLGAWPQVKICLWKGDY